MMNHPVVRLAQLTAEKYGRDDANSLAASIAYFTLFSFFPLLLVLISLVSFFVDPTAANVQDEILNLVGSEQVRDLITQTLANFSQNRVNAGLIGTATLLMGATGIFGALDRAFEIIWETRLNGGEQGLRATVKNVVFSRLVSFGLLLGCAGLILLSVLANFALSAISAYTDWLPRGDLLFQLARFGLTLGLITIALALMFKVLPSCRVAWGDVWPAALITALLFVGLQSFANLIFSQMNFASYGAIGGVMTFMLWIFLCSQIILIGAEISHAWAKVLGSRLSPP